jgi:DNA-damage-inducible protein J
MAKRMAETAAHDKWFREQVARGVREADDSNTRWVTNEEAKAGWAAKRADLVKRTKGRIA